MSVYLHNKINNRPSALLGGALGPSAAASWYTEGFSLPMDAAKVAAKLASRRGSLGTAVTMEPDFEVLGLVPHGWEDIINPPDTWLERFSVGYLGNLAWTAIGALPVMFAIASWKSFSLGPTSKSERGPDIAQFADVLLTLGSLLAYIGFSFSCCFPGEKNTVPRVLLTGVWAVGAVTHLILAFTSAAPYGLVSAITILCCLFAAALVLGVFGQQAFETPFTVFFVVPYCCLFAIYVVVTSVVIPAIEREAEYVVLGVRIGLILVSGIPPIVTHMSLHHVHKILPRQVRYAFGGVETIVLLPSKILTFLLPPGYAVAAEAVTILVRGSFFCLLPSLTEWYFARRGTNPDSPMWQQIRLHMSQATFVTAQSNFCCILASGQIIICNRYRYGESLRVRQVLLYAMCQFAALGIETIITTAVLHGRGIPISGVYWLFEKREHYSCALLTVAVTVVSISPQFLYSISILDMMY